MRRGLARAIVAGAVMAGCSGAVDRADDDPIDARPVDARGDDAAPDRSPGGLDAGGDATCEPDVEVESGDAPPDARDASTTDAGDERDSAADGDAGRDTELGAADADASLEDGSSEADARAQDVPEDPPTLAEAGLFTDLATRTLAPGVDAYKPAFTLWSDGAVKERWLYLPPGSAIDATDPDHWIFPVGTRAYKMFTVAGKTIETRFLYKTAPGRWTATTYAWSEDGAAATELTTGASDVFGTGYDIPAQSSCTTCHGGAADMLLGVEAIGLGNDGATGLTLAALGAAGRIAPSVSAPVTVPGAADAKAALGYLHANCGNACHNPLGEASFTGFVMRLATAHLGSVEATDTYTTGVNVPSGFQLVPGGALLRIAPGAPSSSAVWVRDGSRGSSAQMPPIDTNLVDATGLATVTAWIEGL